MRTVPPAPLTVLFQTASQWVMHSLLAKLHGRGYPEITESHIILFGNLDCGATYASAIAQRVGVSRQAIYRTVRELQALGLLRLDRDTERRNQKLVVMTDMGMEFANDARQALAEIEEALADRLGEQPFRTMRETLEADWGESLNGDT